MSTEPTVSPEYLETLNYFHGDTLATDVWTGKYKYGNERTPVDMFERHIKEIAEKEIERLERGEITIEKIKKLSEYGQKRYSYVLDEQKTGIYSIIRKNLNFDNIILGGSPMQGIGRHELFSTLSNCFVLGQPHDSYSGINFKEDEITQVMKRRGGAGVDLSLIRPNGSAVHNQAGFSSGVVLFAEGFSNKTLQVAQLGRRGALMLTLNMRHPDSLEFITSKQDLTKITGANISMLIDDDFMEAVVNNSDYLLTFPIDMRIENYDIKPELFGYDKLIFIEEGVYVKKIRAIDYWNVLIDCAWKTAEPGIIFTGNWRKGGTDWVYKQYRPVSTNPCFTGEMEILTDDGEVDFATLEQLCLPKCGVNFPLTLINKYGEEVPGRVWRTGVKKIITLVLEDGTEIRVTPNHMFETIEEVEIQAKDSHGKFLNNFEGDGLEVVKIIDNDEYTEVYDFELKDECHWGIVQGVIAHNCSEIPMEPYNACRLLAVNLFKLIDRPFLTQQSNDFQNLFEKAYNIFYEQIVVGDLLVDLELDYIDRIIGKINSDNSPQNLKDSEILIWQKINRVTVNSRRIGAGFSGLGDLLAGLNLPYYSPEFIAKLFKVKLKAELDATTDLAILYGAFSGFDPELEKMSIYMHDVISIEFPEQYQKMLKYGRRNVSWSTAAPNGSGGIVAQITSGIEPIFKAFYKRRKKCITETDRIDYIDPADNQKFSEYFVLHPKFIEWYKIKYSNECSIEEVKNILENLDEKSLISRFESSPWYKNTADDLDWKQRVEIQSVVQRYTTHAISSTINLPTDIEKSVIGNIYMESWKKGLKGNTVYRDGSRSGILVSSDKYKEKLEEFAKSFIPLKSVKRPNSLLAHYHTLPYKSQIYSIIIGFLDNRPYELFIISGVANLPQVIGDSHEFIEGEIIKESKNWYNFVSDTFIVKEITDVEHDEKMLSILVSGLMSHRTPMPTIIKILDKTKPIAGSFTHRLIKILNNYIVDTEVTTKELCQVCGSELTHKEGCVICEVCGWEKC